MKNTYLRWHRFRSDGEKKFAVSLWIMCLPTILNTANGVEVLVPSLEPHWNDCVQVYAEPVWAYPSRQNNERKCA